VPDGGKKDPSLRREINTAKLPVLKYYKNGETGPAKRRSSYELEIPKSMDVAKKENHKNLLNFLIEEMENEIEHDIIEVSDELYFQKLRESKAMGKVAVTYLYGEDQKIDNTFKSLTRDPWLKGYYIWLAIQNPSNDLLQGSADMPYIQGTYTEVPEGYDESEGQSAMWRFDNNEVRHPTSGYKYEMLFAKLLKMYPHLVTKYMKEMGMESPDEDLSSKHNFKEIESQQDFYKLCLAKKACAIALLPAIDSIDWERDAQEERIKFLQELDKKAEKNLIPVHYTWVNTTCHGEWFKYFDVQPFSAPTVVFYNPSAHRHEQSIGKFTTEEIAHYEHRFVNGRLRTRDTPTPQEDIQFTKKDCQAAAFEANESDEGFDEILAEILAEEEQRKKDAEEEELRYPKKETNKKQKKKKKKKDKKKNKKDEL